jgi:1-deoxy-D-xylulose-5-phosphate reductoisomerase
LKKRIAILGSTGSIGTQALDVVRNHPELFEVEVLTAQNNCDLLISQAREFIPNAVVIANEKCYAKVADGLSALPVKVFAGNDALEQIVELDSIDLVLNALVGYSGLKPAFRAVMAGKEMALANKESLVIAGELIMKRAAEKGVRIIPVDSEHSAIFQCLAGEHPSFVEKIILTASGGPFRGMDKKSLENVTRNQALKHPNWTMGEKITIDSASLMNKGLEVIEARWLFNVEAEKIEVVIHPQSVIHSIVQFIDGSMKAQMGMPDMKLPILYAMAYPMRIGSSFKRFSFTEYPSLTFEAPDPEVFRNLALAYHALKRGGNIPCVMNAANECAVRAFLGEEIRFSQIPEIIEHAMETAAYIHEPGLDDFIDTHRHTLVAADAFIHKLKH